MPMRSKSARVRRFSSAWLTSPSRVGSRPIQTFSAIVMCGTKLSSWWIIAIPASVASRRVQVDRPPLDPDLALVGPDDAGDDLHQGRLAGPVLAHERVHRAGPDREPDPVQRHHARVALRDPLRL